jgi:glycosyltransferase involved in cell wall biosynthesis
VLLSIVICNYNYGQFLDAAILSAVEQTHQDTEVIVVDDGSTDNSREIIAGWSGRVQVILHEQNQGQVAAYNTGFAAARGDVIIFLDSDDQLDRDLGERAVACFEDPAVVKVHYRLRLIDAAGTALGPLIPRRLAEGNVAANLLERGMLHESSPGSGNAYRRSALGRLMPLPCAPADRHAADFFALMGISLFGRIKSLGAEPYASYRAHTADASQRTHFGNAGLQEMYKWQGRYALLRSWITERLGAGYELPTEMRDFSTEKQEFASIVFGAAYVQGLSVGAKFLTSKLVRSIWQRQSSLPERVGLTGWAVAVLVLPRELGMPIARYVCNPASRG